LSTAAARKTSPSPREWPASDDFCLATFLAPHSQQFILSEKTIQLSKALLFCALSRVHSCKSISHKLPPFSLPLFLSLKMVIKLIESLLINLNADKIGQHSSEKGRKENLLQLVNQSKLLSYDKFK